MWIPTPDPPGRNYSPPPIYSHGSVCTSLTTPHSFPCVTMSHVSRLLPGRASVIFLFTLNLCSSTQSSHSGNKPTIQKSFLRFWVWNSSFFVTWKCDVNKPSQSAMYLFPTDLTWTSSQGSVPPPPAPIGASLHRLVK